MANDIVPFSRSIAQSLVDSGDAFPVDFDDAWQWLGYAKKQNAKNKLINNFDQGTDFTLTLMRVNPTEQGFKGGRPYEQIFLTIDCFKSLGMMAGTEQGKEIRKYFLECERIVKESASVTPESLDEATSEMERLKIVATLNPKVAVELLRLEQEKEKTERERIRNTPKPGIRKIQAITDGLTPNEKLIQDIALYIEFIENTKGITPKIRDLHQRFRSRRVMMEDGIVIPINSKILRNLMPDVEALRKVETKPPHLALV